jgi:mRNA interferase RelE/StbE
VRRRLQWAPRARADLDRIGRSSPATAARIRASMRHFVDERVGDVLKLSGQHDLYRLRVGDWRVIFTYEDGGLIVLALRVLNRRDAYR